MRGVRRGSERRPKAPFFGGDAGWRASSHPAAIRSIQLPAQHRRLPVHTRAEQRPEGEVEHWRVEQGEQRLT